MCAAGAILTANSYHTSMKDRMVMMRLNGVHHRPGRMEMLAPSEAHTPVVFNGWLPCINRRTCVPWSYASPHQILLSKLQQACHLPCTSAGCILSAGAQTN